MATHTFTNPDTGATATIISGKPNSGKSKALLDYIKRVPPGTPVLVVSNEFSQQQLVQRVGDVPGVTLLCNVTFEEVLARLPSIATAESSPRGLLLVDGLDYFHVDGTLRDAATALVDEAARLGVSVVMTVQERRTGGVNWNRGGEPFPKVMGDGSL